MKNQKWQTEDDSKNIDRSKINAMSMVRCTNKLNHQAAETKERNYSWKLTARRNNSRSFDGGRKKRT